MGCANSHSAASEELTVLESSFHRTYKIGEKLGEGNFGQVRVAKLRSSKTTHAVKIIVLRRTDLIDDDEEDNLTLEDAESEAAIMRSLQGSPHCVELFETFAEQSLFYLVMERCQASLMDRLDSMAKASEAYVSRIFREMLLGIAYMHKLNLVHRDIKPSNFLLGGNGDTVKLTDFGMSCKMPERGYLTGRCGTAPFMSPELVGQKPYDFKTDVWSMGVTGYVLLYGDFPYVPRVCSSKAMKALILRGEPAPSFAPTCGTPDTSERARSFIRSLMARAKEDRCTAEEALLLPFVCLGMPPAADQADDLTPAFRTARQKTFDFRKQDGHRSGSEVAGGLDKLLSVLKTSHKPPEESESSNSDILSGEGMRASEDTDSTRPSTQSNASSIRYSACSIGSVSADNIEFTMIV